MLHDIALIYHHKINIQSLENIIQVTGTVYVLQSGHCVQNNIIQRRHVLEVITSLSHDISKLLLVPDWYSPDRRMSVS